MSDTTKTTGLSPDVAWSFAKNKEAHFKLLNAMNFSDLRILTPELNIYKDRDQYFDPGANEIHLGTNGIVEIFSPADRAELYNAILYVQGHEEQHRRSTASVPYDRAIKRGVWEVIKYTAKAEGDDHATFRREKDYEDYVNITLRKKDVYLDFGSINSLIAHIANSLEDGRIERIRSARLPGFAEMRKYFRGKFWADGGFDKIEKYEAVKDNPGKRLRVLIREVLSLATCNLYSRGFVFEYGSTPVFDEVVSLKPDIAQAYMAGSVRQMEPHVISISAKLAPYIYQAYKLSDKDVEVKKALEEMMADLIKSMIDKMPDNMPLSERDEDTDDGGANSLFDHSDLVVTLDDETYDKLMEKAKDSRADGGIMIKREHPKEGDLTESEENPSNGGSPAGSDTDDKKESSGDGSGSSGEEEKDASKESGSSSGGEKTDNDKTSGGKGKGKAKPKRGNPKDGDKSGSEDDDSEESSMNPGMETREERRESRKGKANTKAEKPTGTAEDRKKAEEDILNAIRNAGSAAKETAKESIGRVNEQSGHEKKTMPKIVPDTASPVTNEEVKDIMNGTGFSFVEVKRSYPVDEDMPPVVAARGKTLHRKMEKYFRSRKTPNIRNLDTGLIDPARLYGLAMKETDIFRKPGMSKYFDGCAYILIDNSGSMSGEKFHEAVTAATIIEEGFKGLFPIKIVAFDDNYSTVRHQVVKGWDESLPKNCSWNFGAHCRPGQGNADGCSIGVATKELRKRREKKKLLVVLSDGASTEGGSDPVQLTKDAIKNARKNRISVTGIYFEAGQINPNGAAKTFHECYQKDYVCCPLSELDANLTRTFEKFARS